MVLLIMVLNYGTFKTWKKLEKIGTNKKFDIYLIRHIIYVNNFY